MPNWVTNILTVSGEDTILDIAKKYKQDGSDLGSFDFNKIIAMPESLNVIAGSVQDTAVSAYYAECNPREQEEIRKMIEKYNSKKTFSSLSYTKKFDNAEADGYVAEQFKKAGVKTYAEYGKIYINNLRLFGAPDWYEWAIEMWGTKWNALSNYTWEDEGEDEENITFETAWSTPEPVIKALSERHPNTYFTVLYGDENYGCNVGKYCYKNGILVTSILPDDSSIEAMNMAAEIFGVWDDLEGFEYDEKNGTYVKKEEGETK